MRDESPAIPLCTSSIFRAGRSHGIETLINLFSTERPSCSEQEADSSFRSHFQTQSKHHLHSPSPNLKTICLPTLPFRSPSSPPDLVQSSSPTILQPMRPPRNSGLAPLLLSTPGAVAAFVPNTTSTLLPLPPLLCSSGPTSCSSTPSVQTAFRPL